MSREALDRPIKVGGSLCLDFCNTVIWRGMSIPIDRIQNYTELIGWSVQLGLVSDTIASRLSNDAGIRRQSAYAVWSRAVGLRDAIDQIFRNYAKNENISAIDMDVVNAELARGPAFRRLELRGQEIVWHTSADSGLDMILGPIARSAADLITNPVRNRIKICADSSCGWLFLDLSRGFRRRWCSMQDCGNRAKARRHYRRHLEDG